VRAVVLVGALAGCYSPTIQAGGACETTCPGDLECIDHVCREHGFVAMTDAAVVVDVLDGPPGDVDADGFNDLTDNCPAKANADQHDEDGDRIGDVCDPCPHIAGDAADGDGDGVGDACDPQPMIAKQSIKFFDPFTSARPEWELVNGYTRVGETLRGQGVVGNSAFLRLHLDNAELRIETGGTIASRDTTNYPHQVSMAFGIDPGGSNYHYVEFYDSSSAGGSIAITKSLNDTTYTTLDSHSVAAPMATGAWKFRVDESVTNQSIKLLATQGGTNYALLTGSAGMAPPPLTAGSIISMLVRNADVRYDYFIAIETAP
jgi:hypothetical protein